MKRVEIARVGNTGQLSDCIPTLLPLERPLGRMRRQDQRNRILEHSAAAIERLRLRSEPRQNGFIHAGAQGPEISCPFEHNRRCQYRLAPKVGAHQRRHPGHLRPPPGCGLRAQPDIFQTQVLFFKSRLGRLSWFRRPGWPGLCGRLCHLGRRRLKRFFKFQQWSIGQ